MNQVTPPTLPAGVWPVMLTPFRRDLSIDGPGVDALTDWYIAAGVSGLFAVCLSSEMYALEPEERLALAERVVRRSAGRVPVVASGTFGGPIEEQAAFVRRMAETGVDGVVAIVSQLAAADEEDDVWLERAARLADLTPGVPLGLYECPRPYHRLLTADQVAWAARSGRYLLLKDTACRMGPIRAKVAATRGTPLRFLNAHTPTLLASLQVGGDGYCGTAANWYPRLLVWLSAHHAAQPERAARLQHLLGVMDRTAAHKYPASAKAFLARLGLPIEAWCRVPCPEIEEPDITILEHLVALVAEEERALGLPDAGPPAQYAGTTDGWQGAP